MHLLTLACCDLLLGPEPTFVDNPVALQNIFNFKSYQNQPHNVTWFQGSQSLADNVHDCWKKLISVNFSSNLDDINFELKLTFDKELLLFVHQHLKSNMAENIFFRSDIQRSKSLILLFNSMNGKNCSHFDDLKKRKEKKVFDLFYAQLTGKFHRSHHLALNIY